MRIPVAGIDLSRWLSAQRATARGFWSERDGSVRIAWSGVADELHLHGSDPDSLLRELERALDNQESDQACGLRYYGGLRFDMSTTPSAEWAPFGTARFILPRFEIREDDEGQVLILNSKSSSDREELPSADDILQAASARGPRQTPIGTGIQRTDNPLASEWRTNVEWCLSAFAHSSLAKVVLARKASFELPDTIDAVDLLDRLRTITPDCHHFLFQFGNETAFFGASPERLLRVEGRRVYSEAVAGTRPRGRTGVHDRRLRDSLLSSEKDRREHEYVRQTIKEQLSQICRTINVDRAAGEMKLSHGRHLVSAIDGVLDDGVSPSDVLKILHPTPAVGGYPRNSAMDVIRQLESFDRGWYAGPVGWIEQDRCSFAVGIRSALVSGTTMSMYSGAGIVSGSDPDAEWNEVEGKILGMLRVIGATADSES